MPDGEGRPTEAEWVEGIWPADTCEPCTLIVQADVVCIGFCDGIEDDDDLQERVDAYAEHLDDMAWSQISLHGGAMRHRGRWRTVETVTVDETVGL